MYNRRGELRKPDILIEFQCNEHSLKFVFDAKYRNYARQGFTQFKEDVIAIAKKRYLKELELSCCFILHTDSSQDYWGEVPFERFAREKFVVETDERDYVGHQYGAIALVPGVEGERQIQRILRLLFQYHARELSQNCLTCGQQLQLGEDIRSSLLPDYIDEQELIKRVITHKGKLGNGTGLYCSCPKCGDFWVVQTCYGNHHYLLKFKDSFHRQSDCPEYRESWMYICPECGSDPSPEDLHPR